MGRSGEKSQKTTQINFCRLLHKLVWPLQKIAAEVFTRKDVGDYVNKKFVSVKYDVEKPNGLDSLANTEIKFLPSLPYY